ncbi:MAG: nucleoside hydrolase-like domain-containing protein [Bacteroidales bacterium]
MKPSHIRSLIVCTFLTGVAFTFSHCSVPVRDNEKPRIIVSSDIGGTDPDDFQSMIHLLMYADLFRIEGLISSPFGKGRKADILDMIDLYEEDFGKLKAHSSDFPEPEKLRKICKQGAKAEAPFEGYSAPTEGSEWIIQCAKKESDQPLWILVWGGIEDLAQALHDAPEIKEKIRVYWIGGPNKKWSVNAYAYIAGSHPDLWMIEANATYRGWFMDSKSPENLSDEAYYDNFIQGRGALGKAFKNYYDGEIKMGDTPSLAYLMNGDPDNPAGESWGGSFSRIDRSSRTIFLRNTSLSDTVAAYSVMEWRWRGPLIDLPADSAYFTLEVSNQQWPGFYLGEGIYGVRYSSKTPEVGSYMTNSGITELDGLSGQYVSTVPWPGMPGENDFLLGKRWYTDRPEPELFMDVQQGAWSVARHREEFLSDWAARWKWLEQ